MPLPRAAPPPEQRVRDRPSAAPSAGPRRHTNQIAIAFDDDPRSPTTDRLARFALAAFDGAFVASQADPGVTLAQLLQPLAPALVAARRALRGRAR
jgi:hypothetical protein